VADRNSDMTSNAIDAAYMWHMQTLFALMAKHVEGGHVDQGRAAFRKALAAAQQTRAEMQAIAQESLCP